MVPPDGRYTDAALDVVLERVGGEFCWPTDDVEIFGSVNTRDNGCCRIRSSPEGSRPVSGSSKGDLRAVRESDREFCKLQVRREVKKSI